MKKTLLAVMAVLMMSVMLIAGCSSGEEAAPAADKKSGRGFYWPALPVLFSG